MALLYGFKNMLIWFVKREIISSKSMDFPLVHLVPLTHQTYSNEFECGWTCKTISHLLRVTVQHQLNGRQGRTHIHENLSVRLESAEVLSLVQTGWPEITGNHREL